MIHWTRQPNNNSVTTPTFLRRAVIRNGLRARVYEPMLEALCSMRGDPDAKALKFLTEAWKAAHAKAKALGWLAP